MKHAVSTSTRCLKPVSPVGVGRMMIWTRSLMPDRYSSHSGLGSGLLSMKLTPITCHNYNITLETNILHCSRRYAHETEFA